MPICTAPGQFLYFSSTSDPVINQDEPVYFYVENKDRRVNLERGVSSYKQLLRGYENTCWSYINPHFEQYKDIETINYNYTINSCAFEWTERKINEVIHKYCGCCICLAGYYCEYNFNDASSKGVDYMIRCPKDRYCPPGSVMYKVCPNNTVTDGEGATRKEDCHEPVLSPIPNQVGISNLWYFIPLCCVMGVALVAALFFAFRKWRQAKSLKAEFILKRYSYNYLKEPEIESKAKNDNYSVISIIPPSKPQIIKKPLELLSIPNDLFFKYDQLTLDTNSVIGTGNFGIIYKGILKIDSHDSENIQENQTTPQYIEAAVKIIKNDTVEEVRKFIDEIRKTYKAGYGLHDHPNALGILGVFCPQDQRLVSNTYQNDNPLDFSNKFMLLTRYHKFGSLDKYLKKRSPKIDGKIQDEHGIPIIQALYWAREIITGLIHLQDQGILHLDLATRNVLVKADLTVCICDYGLSENAYDYVVGEGDEKLINNYDQNHEFLYDNHAFESKQKRAENSRKFKFSNLSSIGTKKYKSNPNSKFNNTRRIPIRWFPPIRRLPDLKLSTPTDIWMYAVTIWEIFALAARPYAGMSDTEFSMFLQNGGRLSYVRGMPQELYVMLLRCWHKVAEKRISFEAILEELTQIIKDFENKFLQLKTANDTVIEDYNSIAESITSINNNNTNCMTNFSGHFQNKKFYGCILKRKTYCHFYDKNNDSDVFVRVDGPFGTLDPQNYDKTDEPFHFYFTSRDEAANE